MQQPHQQYVFGRVAASHQPQFQRLRSHASAHAERAHPPRTAGAPVELLARDGQQPGGRVVHADQGLDGGDAAHKRARLVPSDVLHVRAGQRGACGAGRGRGASKQGFRRRWSGGASWQGVGCRLPRQGKAHAARCAAGRARRRGSAPAPPRPCIPNRRRWRKCRHTPPQGTRLSTSPRWPLAGGRGGGEGWGAGCVSSGPRAAGGRESAGLRTGRGGGGVLVCSPAHHARQPPGPKTPARTC